MRWSIIRLIWFREMRDQLRDRRTLFMIAVLPILLYPLAGIGMMQLYAGFKAQKNTVRIVGYKNLPPWSLRYQPAVAATTWLAMTPLGPGAPLDGIERLICAASLRDASRLEYPPLLDQTDERTRFLSTYYDGGKDPALLVLELVDFPADTDPNAYLKVVDRSDLDSRKLDLIVVIAPGFSQALRECERPALNFLVREGDDKSRLALNRVTNVLIRWKARLKETRLLRQGLAADFDEPFDARNSQTTKTSSEEASDQMSKMLSQVFPFVLVMWSLAGALYPAVDLCAGEKERGTMETLLISPVSREEIVWGKFLTIWVFSAATALLNLVSMGLTTWYFIKISEQVGDQIGSQLAIHTQFRLSFLIWGSILLLPLSAFFSALCLSVGVYARSSKEGQYYLMPLFIVTMPLVFLTLAPGVELNHFYSMVPVTGVALLLQSLIKSGSVTSEHWMYFLPVLAPMVIYCWLALRWAIEQFQREEVLFREAERLDIGLWLKRLFREKELIPSTGQAMFCFLVVLIMHWGLMSAYARRSPHWELLLVGYLVCLTVPVFMSLMLTRHPLASMGLRRPPGWAWPAAVLLAVLILVPGVELTIYILRQIPAIRASIEASQPQLRDAGTGTLQLWTFDLLYKPFLLALFTGVFEEVTFRGFVFNGLRRHFRPWMAIFLTSFLFAFFQMNVFQCVPHFLIGAVLGYVAWRSGSVLPAIVLHVTYSWMVLELPILAAVRPDIMDRFRDAKTDPSGLALAVGAVSALLAAGVLVGMSYLRRRPDAVEEFEERPGAKTA